MSKADNKANCLSPFYNPLVGFIGTIVGVIGVLLSIYFYIGSKEKPKLVYCVYPSKAVVMKAERISKLSIYYNQKPIKTDITVAQIAIWNDGTAPIKRNNILSPIFIHTEVDDIPILEATIRKLSREVTDLALDQNRIDKGQVGISWNILEPKDGGIIQVIYAGDTNIKLLASGIIEGQNQIECFKLPNDRISLEKGYKVSNFSLLCIGITSLIMGILVTFYSLITIWGKSIRKKTCRSLFSLLAGLLSIGGGIYLLYLYRQSVRIPFGC